MLTYVPPALNYLMVVVQTSLIALCREKTYLTDEFYEALELSVIINELKPPSSFVPSMLVNWVESSD